MWPGLADNDEASSPMRARENQGCWEREREGMSVERDGMRRVLEGGR